MKHTFKMSLTLGLLTLTLGAGNPNPTVLPPDAKPKGLRYGAWSDAWWRWALSIPAATNPMLDSNGAYATIGQTGSVFFLAGNQGGTTERTVTVPTGRMLFFPLVNYVWVNTPQFGDPPWSPEQEAYARALIAAQIDSVSDLSCQVDGRQIKDLAAYRCQTPAGEAELVTLPEGNIFGIPADTYGPMVNDGYYLMLAPLSAGKHTIHFAASMAGGFHLDVTYHLTVR